MDVRIRLGMMEDYPSPYANIPYDVVECPEHIALSLEASKRSMVLLKNDNHFLPLKQEQVHTTRQTADGSALPGISDLQR